MELKTFFDEAHKKKTLDRSKDHPFEGTLPGELPCAFFSSLRWLLCAQLCV